MRDQQDVSNAEGGEGVQVLGLYALRNGPPAASLTKPCTFLIRLHLCTAGVLSRYNITNGIAWLWRIWITTHDSTALKFSLQRRSSSEGKPLRNRDISIEYGPFAVLEDRTDQSCSRNAADAKETTSPGHKLQPHPIAYAVIHFNSSMRQCAPSSHALGYSSSGPR